MLSDERLAEIRARAGECLRVAAGWSKPYSHNPSQQIVHDVNDLLAEIDRLRSLLEAKPDA
jgi:hypothetical protein